MTENHIWQGPSELLARDLPSPINCVVTDPPYGVNHQSRQSVTPEGKKWATKIKNDADLSGALALFQDVMKPIIPKMAEHSDLYVFTRWDIVDAWMSAVRSLPDIAYKMLLVWEKGSPGMGDIDANWGCGHELILYCKKGRRDVPERRSGVIHVDQVPASKMIHPNEKPVGVIEVLLRMSATKGDLIVDPFSGSASTSVAAQRLGMHSIGIDDDPVHVQRGRARLSALTFDFA